MVLRAVTKFLSNGASTTALEVASKEKVKWIQVAHVAIQVAPFTDVVEFYI